jgi:hypothetical protein
MTEAEVIDRINSTIKKNGKNAITGEEMNFVLKAIIQLIADAGGTVNWGEIEGTIADQLDLIALLDDKVDVVAGKGLSENDFTDALKSKLDGIEAGAEVNVKADWTATSGDSEILNKPTIPDPADFVAKSDYSPAHSVLVQQSGTGSPTAVAIGTNEILGRKSGGGSNIEGLSVSEVKAILNYTASDVGAPSGSGTSSGTNTGDQTFLNARVQTVISSATVTAVNTNDLLTITAQAVGLTLANPTGAFTEGQSLIFRIKDNGTPQTIGYGINFRAIGVTAPITTVANKTTYIGCIYNSTDTKFDIIGVCTEA